MKFAVLRSLGLLAGLMGASWIIASCCGTKADPDCPATPLGRNQILPPNEGSLRNEHQHLETDLVATLDATATILERQPELADADHAGRRARMEEVGAVHVVTSIDELVKDRDAAIALGKAFFWDVAAGSDGQTACATCHYEAGADARVLTGEERRRRTSLGVAARIFRGLNGGEALESSDPFGKAAAFALLEREWPAHAERLAIVEGYQEESGARQRDSERRQSTPKNSPTVIGASHFDRLFHDGRARAVFNGYDEFGDDGSVDPVGKWRCRGGRAERVLIRIPHAALASQATVPVMSPVEMSWYGRRFYHLAQKLLPRRPLSLQSIHPDDSLLAGRIGTSTTYRDMIRAAFRSEWVEDIRVGDARSREPVTGEALNLRAVEANFSMIWGVSVMLYEATLVADQTPYDRGNLSKAQREGLQRFRSIGCADCHQEPGFSAAMQSQVYGPHTEFEGPEDVFAEQEVNEFVRWVRRGRPGLDARAERMLIPIEKAPPHVSPKTPVAYDNGFYDVGFALAAVDPGLGRQEVMSAADSKVRDYEFQRGAGTNRFDPLAMLSPQFGGQGDCGDALDACMVARGGIQNLEGLGYPARTDGGHLRSLSIARRKFPADIPWILGTVKTPSLRNIGLTGPYFMDDLAFVAVDGTAPVLPEGFDIQLFDELKDAVRAYKEPPWGSRNDFTNPNIHPEMPLDDLTDADAKVIVKFLEALTDPRVPAARAPFDHPSIDLPIVPDVGADGRTPTDVDAVVRFKRVAATGRAGVATPAPAERR